MPAALKPEEVNRLRSHLGEIPDLYEHLPSIYEASGSADTGDSGAGGSFGPARSTGSPSLINLEIVHLTDQRRRPWWPTHDPGTCTTIARFGVLPSLSWWAVLFHDEMTSTPGVRIPAPVEPLTVRSTCGWLAEVEPFALTTSWPHWYARDINAIHTRLLPATTGHQPFVPRCDNCGARLAREVTDGDFYRCPSCRRVYSQASRVDREHPRPGEEIAAVLGIPWATLRTWDKRGVIRAKGRDSQRRKLYLMADVRRAAQLIRTDRKGRP